MAYKEDYSKMDGVWRTVGGRRIFIKTGQTLEEAMRESGKFKKLDETSSKDKNKNESTDFDDLDEMAKWKVQDHILRYFKNIENLVDELDTFRSLHSGEYEDDFVYNDIVFNDNVYDDSVYDAAIHMVESGYFAGHYNGVRDFLDYVGIKQDTEEKNWELYKRLIATSCERLYNEYHKQK